MLESHLTFNLTLSCLNYWGFCCKQWHSGVYKHISQLINSLFSLTNWLMFQPGLVLPSGQYTPLYILILIKAARLHEYAQLLACSEHELESLHTPTCDCSVKSRARGGGGLQVGLPFSVSPPFGILSIGDPFWQMTIPSSCHSFVISPSNWAYGRKFEQ